MCLGIVFDITVLASWRERLCVLFDIVYKFSFALTFWYVHDYCPLSFNKSWKEEPETSNTLCINPMSDINTDSEILPLELVDKAIGSQIRILLINGREFEGTLVGFDEFVNVILSDVTETGPEGTIHRDEMLLTGTTIAMFVTV